mgnify:FL=1|tara:strand:- start:823 stop:1014 length:192 start_codon:yes stop_codon:yes gene_type:complete
MQNEEDNGLGSCENRVAHGTKLQGLGVVTRILNDGVLVEDESGKTSKVDFATVEKAFISQKGN